MARWTDLAVSEKYHVAAGQDIGLAWGILNGLVYLDLSIASDKITAA